MNYKERLHRVIPGGAHTYSRGDDQYPDNAPQILMKGLGAEVWDPFGKRYVDYGMGLRAVTLGYGNEHVTRAANKAAMDGNCLARPSVTELHAAERLVEIIPNVEMVKFAKNGSTVTSAAMKLARAFTGKKYIAVCADHPFYSYDDWFIGSTVCARGVPEEIRSLTIKFRYNDIGSLRELFDKFPDDIAAVILEPTVFVPPKEGCQKCPYLRKCECTKTFLEEVKKCCEENQALFVLDEMITGFRWDFRGAQEYFGISADLVTFGKGMANGFSVAALTGRREVMELGGLGNEGQERIFLVSTTHGAEMSGLGAFLKTMELYEELDVVNHLWCFGRELMDGMNSISRELGVENYFSIEGYPCSPVIVTKDKDGYSSLDYKTLFSQEMVNCGVLMPWIALSLSHGKKELDLTLEAARSALKIYQRALDDGAKKYLKGSAIKPVFRQYN